MLNHAEDLQRHINTTHQLLANGGLKPLPDGRFQLSEQFLRTVLEYVDYLRLSYCHAHPAEAGAVIADVEKNIQSKKSV